MATKEHEVLPGMLVFNNGLLIVLVDEFKNLTLSLQGTTPQRASQELIEATRQVGCSLIA